MAEDIRKKTKPFNIDQRSQAITHMIAKDLRPAIFARVMKNALGVGLDNFLKNVDREWSEQK